MSGDLPSSPELMAIEALPGVQRGERKCGVYWGSHGCDRPEGHEMPHVCGLLDPDGVCSTHDGTSVRFVMGAGVSGDVAKIDEEITIDVLGERHEMPTFT